MIIGNPLTGTLHLAGWNRPAGNIDFILTQPFGCTGVIYERPLGNCSHFHRGLDFANGHCGGNVLAAAAGTVHFAGRVTDGAIVVEIDHGAGWFTAYAHLSSEKVAVGQHVTQGQQIGTVGDTGNSTACHLHFALKSGANITGSILSDTNGTWVDPWTHLAQNAPAPGTMLFPGGKLYRLPMVGQSLTVGANAPAFRATFKSEDFAGNNFNPWWKITSNGPYAGYYVPRGVLKP